MRFHVRSIPFVTIVARAGCVARLRTIMAFLVLLRIAVPGTPALGDAPPARVEAPAVPEALAARGTVYHTISGRQAQVTFTSDAPLQDIVGKTNAVVGYAVAGPKDAPAALAGARWLLPVASLATGIPLRDAHLAGEHWLDAAKHPVVEFVLERTEDIERVKTGDGFSTWSATLVGTMAMHGLRRPFRVEKAKLSFLDASERTRPIAPGDLLFLQCAYEVKLSDFGVVNGDVPGKVADTIRIAQMLRLSTAEVAPGTDPVDRAGAVDHGDAESPPK
ncbi:MAG: YceI family protein [Phycisphaeraceae bacterium]|nr:YceI family protein [Phycisphaeraceae bacterium]